MAKRQRTTGYEFIGLAGGLFVDPSAERHLSATYARFIGQELEFGQIVVAAKRQVLRYSLNSELHVLAHELHRLTSTASNVVSRGAARVAKDRAGRGGLLARVVVRPRSGYRPTRCCSGGSATS